MFYYSFWNNLSILYTILYSTQFKPIDLKRLASAIINICIHRTRKKRQFYLMKLRFLGEQINILLRRKKNKLGKKVRGYNNKYFSKSKDRYIEEKKNIIHNIRRRFLLFHFILGRGNHYFSSFFFGHIFNIVYWELIFL